VWKVNRREKRTLRERRLRTMPVDKDPTKTFNVPTYRSLTHPARTQTQRAYTFGLEMEFDDLKVDHKVNESINEDSFQEKKEYTG
jgi:hypothetical protein